MEANAYIANANLSRSRTNHTHGGRVLSLRCSVPLCPIRSRLVSILNAAEGVQPFRLEKVEEDHHNHQAEVEPIRGLSDAQKAILNLCIERGQSAPKMVRELVQMKAAAHNQQYVLIF